MTNIEKYLRKKFDIWNQMFSLQQVFYELGAESQKEIQEAKEIVRIVTGRNKLPDTTLFISRDELIEICSFYF